VIALLNGFTVFLQGNWDVSSFIAAYISECKWECCSNCPGLPIFFFCYFGWKIVKKTKIVPLAEIDFMSGLRELDEMQARDEERFKAETKWQKFISILF
jgi:amino acid transporter